MKLLIIPSWYETERNDTGIFFKEQAKALAEKGIEVAIAYCDVRLRLGKDKKGIKITKDGLITVFTYTKRNLTPFWEKGVRFQQTYMLKRLYKKIEKEFSTPDIVHLHSCLAASSAISLCQNHNLPLVFTEHSSKVALAPKNSYYDRLLNETVKFSACSIAVGNELYEKMHSISNKTKLIPNMVDTSIFMNQQNEDHSYFVFEALGSLRKIKGYDVLINAFNTVYSGNKNVKLLIGGTGEEEINLKSQCNNLDLSDCIEFCGNIPRNGVCDFINKCDCFICSSHKETFSIVLIEALACGKPIIATRCGGPEGIVNADNGLLVEPNDYKALALAMNEMLQFSKKYDSQKIALSCKTNYDKDVICNELISIYQNILIK